MSTEPTTTALAAPAPSIFDNDAFASITRIAGAMARGSLIPKTLTEDKEGVYPLDKIEANCFLVTEQAMRWGLSPFAVIGCASVVHGRLMWEGKLISAVLTAKLGLRLDYDYEGLGEARKVVVTGTIPGEDQPRTVEGTVGAWKTTGNGSPWDKSANHDRQLAYRGAREWARRHASEVILGVVTDDEPVESRQDPPRNVTPKANPFENRPADKRLETAAPEPTSKPKAEPLANVPAVDKVRAYVERYECKTGKKKNGSPWKLHIAHLTIEGKEVIANTFSEAIGSLVEFNVEQWALVELKETPKGFELASIDFAAEDSEEGVA